MTHRALNICSPELLDEEIKEIAKIFLNNGYPETLVWSTIDSKTKHFRNPSAPVEGPPRCPVYIRLPYIGTLSQMYKKRITDAVRRCFYSVNLRVILTSKPILQSAVKDVLPSMNRSNLVYLFSCCCESKYVGRTSQRLQSRIKQHIPKNILKVLGTNKKPKSKPSSAIAQHLLKNISCGKQYQPSMFTIIGNGRSKFHLQVLEALHIVGMDPLLCRQKEFVYSMLLFNKR